MTDLITVIGLIASIASLVLAVVAIWLAVVFYRLSRDESESSAQNAQEISTSISRLEKVFDGLYSDTFTIMKDTVTDMRQHIWRKGDSTEISAEAASPQDDDNGQSEPVLQKLEEFSAQLGIADDKIEALRKLLTPVVEESTEKHLVDSHEDTKQRVLQLLLSRGPHRPVQLMQLVNWIRPDDESPDDIVRSVRHREVSNAVFSLREEGKVTWDGDSHVLSSNSRVRVLRRDGKPQVSSEG
ncbi:hypothetical protein [Arthrobacter sp. FW306-07-I]|uniref:hypothetical protein n=1 Tax=Arthrobacter sp. FW306-07-I TaxID=2879622 RepID=UPI001F2FAA51|nr:hypothetical protein [Arthrobacter sp. FW306-07-I]UKA76450.1 hypothetical protein LFT46_05170 [Arthrobacter sp. FW306-07-I]